MALSGVGMAVFPKVGLRSAEVCCDGAGGVASGDVAFVAQALSLSCMVPKFVAIVSCPAFDDEMALYSLLGGDCSLARSNSCQTSTPLLPLSLYYVARRKNS